MAPLTPRQLQVVRFIRDFIQGHDYAPTMQEIAQGVRISKPTAQQYLRALEDKGVIRRRRYAHRSIELLWDEEADASALPLVGRIAAGGPIEAIEDRELVNLVDALGVRKGRDHFLLRVKGDSMIGDGIFDGDYVVVEKRNTAQNGETVVALLPDGDATLKKFYREADHIRLQPANPGMGPIYAKDVTIQGVVKGVFRSVR